MRAVWAGGDGGCSVWSAGSRVEVGEGRGARRLAAEREEARPPRHEVMVRVAGGGGKRPRKLGDGQGSPLTMCGRA